MKIIESLFNKSWVIFCLSVILGFALFFAIPASFIDKMPFAEKDWNKIAIIVLLILAIYLILAFIRFLYMQFLAHRKRKKESRDLDNHNKQQISQGIEKYKSFIDQLSDRDYSILMYLLDNKNTKPYIGNGSTSMLTDSILDYDDWFYKTPCESEGYSYGMQQYKYLLTKDKYQALSYILENTGSITHFDRKRENL